MQVNPVTLEDLPPDVMGRVLVLCGRSHRGVARTWAALSQSSKALRDLMRVARLDVRELYVRGPRVTDALLTDITTTFTGLTSLDLYGCDRITDAGVKHLARLTGLTSLDLSWCRITDAGLADLARLTSLTSLDLKWCHRIGEDGLAHLARLTSLTSLDLRGFLYVTNAGLEHLAQLTGLTSLNLSYCRRAPFGRGITDAGLAHLAKQLTGLRELELYGCERITIEGVYEFHEVLPWCSVGAIWFL